MNNFSFPSVSPIFKKNKFCLSPQPIFTSIYIISFMDFCVVVALGMTDQTADGCKSERLLHLPWPYCRGWRCSTWLFNSFMSWIKVSSGQVSESWAGAILTWNCRVVIATSFRVSSSHFKVFRYLGINWILDFFLCSFHLLNLLVIFCGETFSFPQKINLLCSANDFNDWKMRM